ncbi:MAG: MFS transporter [Proteobacteria bacterium]|nr:MFS transporter [Pseudomonadota bacterium]
MTVRGRLGLYYLLLLGAIGSLNPWLAVILEDAGASGTGKALILTTFPVGVLLAGPAGAWIADRTGREIGVLRGAAVLSLGASIGLLVAAASGALIGLALGAAALAMTRAPLAPVADMATVRRVGLGRYSAVRAYGSIGFILAALLVGALLDDWPTAPLWIGVATLGALAALTFTLPETPEAERQRSSTGGFAAIRTVLGIPVLAALCVVACLHRGTIGFYDQFYAHHTTDILGLPGWVPGLSIALGVALEVGILTLGRHLLDRFGPMTLVLIAVVSQIPRWVLTASLVSPGLLIATQVLHGLGFGLWWVGGVALVARHAPEELRNTAQGVFVAAGHGIGSFLALGVAAVMLDGPGTGAAFQVLAAISSMALAVTLLWLLPASRRSGQGSPGG